MATLAADKVRQYELSGETVFNELPVIATDIIYAGSAVGESTTTGTFRPLSGGDAFAGFCVEKCDNSAGAANDKQVRVRAKGFIWLTITNVDNINDEGATIYASDDDTFTTVNTTTNTAIGKLVRYDANRTNKGLVYFEAAHLRSI